jgi:hypothetical protein
MSIWTDELGLMMSTFDKADIFQPPMELTDKDNVIGPVSEDLQILFSLSLRFEKEAAELVLQATFSNPTRESIEQIQKKINECKNKGSILRDIFWASLKDQHGMWDKPETGIRAGWHFVWVEPTDDPIRRMLGGMFG